MAQNERGFGTENIGISGGEVGFYGYEAVTQPWVAHTDAVAILISQLSGLGIIGSA